MLKILFLILFLIFTFDSYSSVALRLVPREVKIGKIGLMVQLDIEIYNHPVPNDIMGIEIVIHFDTNYLTATDMLGNEATKIEEYQVFNNQIVFCNVVDNTTGQIHYSIGTILYEDAISTPRVISTLYFKTKQKGITYVSFDRPNCIVIIGAASGYVYDYIPQTIINAKIDIGDFTAPEISGIGVKDISRSTATIYWNTNELATTELEYGTSPILGNYIKKEGELKTTHEIKLTNLESLTTYYYKIIAVDEANNKSETSLYEFTTTNEDKTPPVINHTPIISAIENEEISIEAEVKDDVEVGVVLLYYKRASDSEFKYIQMEKYTSSYYNGKIIAIAPYIEYYIVAIDIFSNSSREPQTNSYKIEVTNRSGKLEGYVKTTIGLPIPNANIYILGTGISAITNEEGKFEVAKVPIGEYKIKIQVPNYVTQITATPVEIREGITQTIHFILERECRISGKVIREDKNTFIEGAKIIIKKDNEKACEDCEVKSDANGEYYIAGFGKGTYDIYCKKIGFEEKIIELVFDEGTEFTYDFKLLPLPLYEVSIIKDGVMLKKDTKITVQPHEIIKFSAIARNVDYIDLKELGINVTFSWYVAPSIYGKIDNTGSFEVGEYEGNCTVGVVAVSEGGDRAEGRIKVEITKAFRFEQIIVLGCDLNAPSCEFPSQVLRKPFSPRRQKVKFSYQLTDEAYEVIIKIYTMRGRLVKEIHHYKYTNKDKIEWDGRDNLGRIIPNGVYIYQLTARGPLGTTHSKPQLIGVFK